MMKEFVEYIVRHLVDQPELVAIEEESTENSVTLRLRVGPGDTGKVIGRNGRTAQALRTLLVAKAARQGKRASLEILE